MFCWFERDLVFVVVPFEIGPETDEEGHFPFFHLLHIILGGLQVSEHFDPLISADVEVHVPESGACVAVLEVADLVGEGLLVQAAEVGGLVVDLPADPGWDHVIDRLPVRVLFDVDGSDVEIRLRRIVLDVLPFGEAEIRESPPIAPDQFQSGKTEHHLLFPVLQEHP